MVQANHNSSTVRVITDGQSAVGVRYGPADHSALAVLNGQGAGKPLSAAYVPNETALSKGEVFMTSGLQGATYPAGIPVAQVESSSTGVTARRSRSHSSRWSTFRASGMCQWCSGGQVDRSGCGPGRPGRVALCHRAEHADVGPPHRRGAPRHHGAPSNRGRYRGWAGPGCDHGFWRRPGVRPVPPDPVRAVCPCGQCDRVWGRSDDPVCRPVGLLAGTSARRRRGTRSTRPCMPCSDRFSVNPRCCTSTCFESSWWSRW